MEDFLRTATAQIWDDYDYGLLLIHSLRTLLHQSQADNNSVIACSKTAGEM
jgi:hypothetical protein